MKTLLETMHDAIDLKNDPSLIDLQMKLNIWLKEVREEVEKLKFTTKPIGSEHSYARGIQTGANDTVEKVLQILK